MISGDLTYRGDPAEFEQARDLLVRLGAGLGIPRERIHLVPGNHDVNWGLARVDRRNRFDPYVSFLELFYDIDLCRRKYPAITSLFG